MTNQEFLTIKEAAQHYGRSEQTIRRLVKQHALTSHVRSENTSKGKAYRISQVLLQQEYDDFTPVELLGHVEHNLLQQENCKLREAVVERDQIIQQLQNRLFEQGDMMNAMANQMTSQKISHIEELLIQQNLQLGDLQKRLPSADVIEPVSNRPSLWSRLFGR